MDSSYLNALAREWHEHHASTHADFERRKVAGDHLIVAAHALAETYSVLTRLPPAKRLTPDEAMATLRTWEDTDVVALSATEYWETLRECQRRRIPGGQTYDALIAACARKASATQLLTWNVRHFAPWGNEFTAQQPTA